MHLLHSLLSANKTEVKEKQLSTRTNSLDMHMLDGKGMKQIISS